MSDSWLAILTEGLSRLDIAPAEADNAAALRRVCRYYAELRKWSRSINLVAAAPEREQLETHFLDSLTLWPLIVQKCGIIDSGSSIIASDKGSAGLRVQARTPEPATPGRQSGLIAPRCGVIDVGSGAGFPGLVLKCWRPELLTVTLVEPRLKRVSFLRHVIRTLDLKGGIKVLPCRLEPGDRRPGLAKDQEGGQEGGSQESGEFTLITSRACAAIAPLLNLCAPITPPGGLVVCMKGPRAEEELARWRLDQSLSPFLLEEVRTFSLPFSGAPRNLLVFRRLAA